MARVLLVEDDPAIRCLIKEALTASGHEVMQAADGRAGLRVFGASQFDLVITDILMPDTDGLEFIRKVREQGSSVKIVAVSGGGGALYRGDALKAATRLGADAVVPKPLRLHELRDLVTAILAIAKRERRAGDLSVRAGSRGLRIGFSVERQTT
jgi:DNA-binding response OmpR family regulator